MYRRAPTAADEARHQSYDTNDDHTTTTARWTVTSATGRYRRRDGAMEEGQGRRERVAVDVGKPIALRRCRTADERDTSANFRRRTTSRKDWEIEKVEGV